MAIDIKRIKNLVWDFCTWNPILTSLYLLLALFSTVMIFFHGYDALLRSIFADLLICAVFCFFRLPLFHRDWLDLDDCFTSIVHIFIGDLHYYIRTIDLYYITSKRKWIVFLYRILLIGVCIAMSIYCDKILDNSKDVVMELSPVLAGGYLVFMSLVGIALAAESARRNIQSGRWSEE